jgi:multiple sugar transport system substrate-binding protein
MTQGSSPVGAQPAATSPGPNAGRRLTRRGLLRLAGATAAGVALAACAAESRPSARPGAKVQLVYRDWRTDWFPPMAQAMLEQFHARNPNIRVFYMPDPEDLDTSEKVRSDLQGGTAPDVFQGCCAWFPSWAQKGYLLDLRPYVKADVDQATLDDWDEAQYRSFFTRAGRQYALPKYHGAAALYFNKDLFDRYHINYPDESWTHEDYKGAMRQLSRDLDGDGSRDLWGSTVDISWERLQIHVNGWGGHFVDPSDPTRCRMADAPALAALECLRARMWDDKVMATVTDVQKLSSSQAFIAGRVAMAEDGSWALKDILSKADFRIGIAPLPAGPVRRVTLATTDGFGIYSGTSHPEAAWELVKFLIGKDYGRAMARANFLQPARASLVDDWVGYIREEFPRQTKDVNIAAFADGHIKGYSVTAEVFANDQDAARRIAYAAWDQILTLGQAPVDKMVVACRQIEEAQKMGQRAPTPGECVNCGPN